MDVSGLLLTSDRLAQFGTALGASGLTTLIAEAEALIQQYVHEYDIDQDVKDGWTRAITLHKAYSQAEFATPEDVKFNYEEAMKEIVAISNGERPAIPRIIQDNTPDTGTWGSATKISTR